MVEMGSQLGYMIKIRGSLSKDVILNTALFIYSEFKVYIMHNNDFESRFQKRANLHDVTSKGESASADSVAFEKFNL